MKREKCPIEFSAAAAAAVLFFSAGCRGLSQNVPVGVKDAGTGVYLEDLP